ncbi:MAG: hypothetical protein F4Y41_08215 [Gammaproteobacteria bacterium]|nr:hypothetical protein [Gammaproteobacteria bacterium]MYF30008.1 hypothetical protein [Gammaproteobacteria bacterium]
MKFSVEIGETTWQLVLLAIAVGLALTKRLLRNTVKIVSGFFSVFGWHRNSVWRTRKLQLPSMNPHTGNLTWGQYRGRQFWTWLRQWAFGETRWLPPSGDSSRRTTVIETTRSGDSARTLAPGVVLEANPKDDAGDEPPDSAS